MYLLALNIVIFKALVGSAFMDFAVGKVLLRAGQTNGNVRAGSIKQPSLLWATEEFVSLTSNLEQAFTKPAYAEKLRAFSLERRAEELGVAALDIHVGVPLPAFLVKPLDATDSHLLRRAAALGRLDRDLSLYRYNAVQLTQEERVQKARQVDGAADAYYNDMKDPINKAIQLANKAPESPLASGAPSPTASVGPSASASPTGPEAGGAATKESTVGLWIIPRKMKVDLYAILGDSFEVAFPVKPYQLILLDVPYGVLEERVAPWDVRMSADKVRGKGNIGVEFN